MITFFVTLGLFLIGIRFRHAIGHAAATVFGLAGGPAVHLAEDALVVGINGAQAVGRRVYRIGQALLGSATALWIVGLASHQGWMIGLGGTLAIAAIAIAWLYAEAFVLYFGTLFRAARAAANLGIRIIFRILQNLRLVEPGPAPAIGTFVPDVLSRVRTIARLIIALIALGTLAVSARPYLTTFLAVGAFALGAVAYVVIARERGYNTGFGWNVAARAALASVAAAAFGFGAMLFLQSGPRRIREDVRLCYYHFTACADAAREGRTFPAYEQFRLRRAAAQVNAVFDQEIAYRERLLVAHLKRPPKAGGAKMMTPTQFAHERGNIERARGRYLAALSVKPSVKLGHADRSEIHAARWILIGYGALALLALLAVVFVPLEPLGAPQADNRWYPRVALALLVLALAVGGYYAFRNRGSGRSTTAAKPTAVAAATTPAVPVKNGGARHIPNGSAPPVPNGSAGTPAAPRTARAGSPDLYDRVHRILSDARARDPLSTDTPLL